VFRAFLGIEIFTDRFFRKMKRSNERLFKFFLVGDSPPPQVVGVEACFCRICGCTVQPLCAAEADENFSGRGLRRTVSVDVMGIASSVCGEGRRRNPGALIKELLGCGGLGANFVALRAELRTEADVGIVHLAPNVEHARLLEGAARGRVFLEIRDHVSLRWVRGMRRLIRVWHVRSNFLESARYVQTIPHPGQGLLPVSREAAGRVRAGRRTKLQWL
jgi:hypothetical protein